MKFKITGKPAKVKQLKPNGSGKPCNFQLPATNPLKFNVASNTKVYKSPKELGKTKY